MGDSTDTSPAEKAKVVKCTDCGFLTFLRAETSTLDEAGEETRATGHFRSGGMVLPAPRCFTLAFKLKQELAEEISRASQDDIHSTRLHLKVIQKERYCESFVQWQQGFSPKEHKEMLQESELRKWQEDRLKADREHQERQRESAERREEERRRDERKHQEDQKEKDRQHAEEQAMKAFRRQLITTFISLAFGALLTALIGYLVRKDSSEAVRPIIIQMPDGKELKPK